MSQPLALCLENLATPSRGPRYVACVAVPGVDHHLGLDAAGTPLWRPPLPPPIELWSGQDARLYLQVLDPALELSIVRAGRLLPVPLHKPVVVIGGDVLELPRASLRVHIHGVADEVHPPAPRPERASSAWPGFATAVALSTAVLGSAPVAAQSVTPPPILEVHDHPPKMAPPRLSGKLSDGEGKGKVDKAKVEAVFAQRRAEIEKCEADGRAKKPDLDGKVTVAFTLSAKPKAKKVEATENTTHVPSLGTCVAERVAAWTFPKTEGGDVSFRYTYYFRDW